MVRLIEQFLYTNGFNDTAATLERESQIIYQTREITELKMAIRGSDFSKALQILKDFNFPIQVILHLEFYISSFKYLSSVRQGDIGEAITILRGEISQSTFFPKEKITLLTNLLMLINGSREEIEEAIFQLNNSLGIPKNKEELIDTIIQDLPESFLIPENRLETLINQACQHQVLSCGGHLIPQLGREFSKETTDFSLFRDHHCPNSVVDVRVVAIIHDHCDEIWHISLSKDGRLIGVCSKDKTCSVLGYRSESGFERIYSCMSISPKLESSFCAFSPNGTRCLFTFNNSNSILLVDISDGNGNDVERIDMKNFTTISCAIFVDEEIIAVGSETDQQIVLYNYSSKRAFFLWNDISCSRLSFTRGFLFAACINGKYLVCIDVTSKKLLYKFEFDFIITHMTPDVYYNRYLLVSGIDNRLVLFNFLTRSIERTYGGHLNTRYHLTNDFIFPNKVACGSENGFLHIWHLVNEKILFKGEICAGISINAVAVDNDRYLVYLGCDDGCIRVCKIIAPTGG